MNVDVKGTRLWFDVDGYAFVPHGLEMRERPTVVLLHGGPGGFDHSYFKPDFARLSTDAQVVYLDLPGHGRSEWGDPARWSFELCADTVRDFCDTLGIARPVVYGHSLGGFVAMLYAARHPGHAGALVLQSTFARFDLGRIVEEFRRVGGDEVAAIVERAYGGDSRSVTDEEWAPCWRLVGSWVPGEQEQARTVTNEELNAPGLALMRGFDVLDQLTQIDCPTLVCVGELDPITPVAAAREIAAALRSGVGRLEVVEGAGHFTWKDAPDRYWPILTEFLTTATETKPTGGNRNSHAGPRTRRAKLGSQSRPASSPSSWDETMTAVNAGSPTMIGESLWPRLAGLPLVIEACEYERLHAVLAYEFERITTHVRLVGAGADGLGEDVSVFREDGTALHETRPSLPLEGEWTLAGFCDHVATLDLWPEPPEWDVALRLRNWAFESAALDLALRQAGRSLHDVLGLEPQPVRFVNSLGLGKEPSIEPVRRRLARSPGVRFKLDSEATWAPELVDEVAATGAVDTIDFKGQYGFEVEDPAALNALYDHVIAAFPDAYLEDPHDLPEIAERLGDHLGRVSYDSPIRSAEDIGATPLASRVVNVKPSRIGSLRALFDVYARCARERRPMYGGGMGELGVGRGQIELLAALFHADAPNDVAPSAYNEDDPPGGLPASPLAPRPEATGFRWAA